MALKPLNPQPSKGSLKAAHTRPPADTTWRPKWLLAAPHRLAFFAGALMLSMSAIWWCSMLFARHLGVAVPWMLAPATAHTLLMTLGFMPLFFAGFLFTAGPKWLAMPAVSANKLLRYVTTTLIGWAICIVGFHVSASMVCLGMVLVALAWSSVTLQFATLWHKSQADDKVHATVVVVASMAGVIAMWVAVVGLALGQEILVRTATQGALWIFVATVFAAVSHRMIPFFSASAVPVLDAWRPLWLLWCMVGVLWFEGVMACMELWLRPNSPGLRWLQITIETPAAILMLWLAVRWGLVQSLKIRLLAMLHGGFLWLGIALALQAVSHALMALSQNQTSLGLAPLHAMTMGYLGATMFAMASRVSSGHSGRPVAADNAAWALYWILQLAVLLRVLSALWADTLAIPLLTAIAAWTVASCGWALRYGNWFGRPRLDGREG